MSCRRWQKSEKESKRAISEAESGTPAPRVLYRYQKKVDVGKRICKVVKTEGIGIDVRGGKFAAGLVKHERRWQEKVNKSIKYYLVN
jgi:hypothetical protein